MNKIDMEGLVHAGASGAPGLQLSPQQVAHARAFGHLVLPRVFSAPEIGAIQREAEAQLDAAMAPLAHHPAWHCHSL